MTSRKSRLGDGKEGRCATVTACISHKFALVTRATELISRKVTESLYFKRFTRRSPFVPAP